MRRTENALDYLRTVQDLAGHKAMQVRPEVNLMVGACASKVNAVKRREGQI
jgi:hypothetical protein